jgi:hypothetical protein
MNKGIINTSDPLKSDVFATIPFRIRTDSDRYIVVHAVDADSARKRFESDYRRLESESITGINKINW